MTRELNESLEQLVELFGKKPKTAAERMRERKARLKPKTPPGYKMVYGKKVKLSTAKKMDMQRQKLVSRMGMKLASRLKK